MNIIKKVLLLGIIFIFTIITGCSKVNGKDTQAIKAPYNNDLQIEGIWNIDYINIIDNEIENKNEVLDLEDSQINISNKDITILNKTYINPKYKLKIVDKTYTLSYEFNLKLEDLVDEGSKFDVISIIDSNTIIGEFVLINKSNGYLFYDGLILKLIKKDNSPKKTEIISSEVKEDEVLEDYNSEVGVMLGMKTPRRLMDDGNYTNEEYKTLWISFKNGTLQPIIEKNNIIFPRMSGIWSISSEIINNDINHHIEYLTAKPLDGREEDQLLERETTNVYKNINFVSNDYISIEKYEGDNFKNKFPIYQTVPIDNINSRNGLNIEEIYNIDSKEKYKKEFNQTIDTLPDEKKDLLDININYSNFTIKRIEGKWSLVGNIPAIDNNNDGIEYRISISPSKKILNYDTLLVSWRDLIDDFPFIKDIYTAPTGRIAIIVFSDKISVYEMEDRNIKGSPLMNIQLSDGEEVIMAEWASGSYVDSWAKAFKDGKQISMEDE